CRRLATPGLPRLEEPGHGRRRLAGGRCPQGRHERAALLALEAVEARRRRDLLQGGWRGRRPAVAVPVEPWAPVRAAKRRHLEGVEGLVRDRPLVRVLVERDRPLAQVLVEERLQVGTRGDGHGPHPAYRPRRGGERGQEVAGQAADAVPYRLEPL